MNKILDKRLKKKIHNSKELDCIAVLYLQIYNEINSYPAKVIYLNFQPLEVVGRCSETQLQVAENYSYSFNLSKTICTFHSNNSDFVD